MRQKITAILFSIAAAISIQYTRPPAMDVSHTVSTIGAQDPITAVNGNARPKISIGEITGASSAEELMITESMI